MKKKIKLGFEIFLMFLILGMIYKLATNNDVRDNVQNAAVEQALNNGDLSGNSVSPPTPPLQDTRLNAQDAQKIAAEIMKQSQSPNKRGDFSHLNE